MKKTTIWIDEKLKDNLDKIKLIPEEYYNTVVKRVILTSSLLPRNGGEI